MHGVQINVPFPFIGAQKHRPCVGTVAVRERLHNQIQRFRRCLIQPLQIWEVVILQIGEIQPDAPQPVSASFVLQKAEPLLQDRRFAKYQKDFLSVVLRKEEYTMAEAEKAVKAFFEKE